MLSHRPDASGARSNDVVNGNGDLQGVSRWTKKQGPAPAGGVIAQVTPITTIDTRPRLGDVLLSEQKLLPEQLTGALNLQVESGRQLGAILVEQGILDSNVR